ncbi:TPA: type IV secretory system conjugative DNA transfer family protein [Streptococcus suis]
MSIWKILKGSYGAGTILSTRLQNNLANHLNSTDARAKSTGYLLSSDRVGYDQVGLKDYSALALPSDFKQNDLKLLSQGAMSLGEFFSPRPHNPLNIFQSTTRSYPFSIPYEELFKHTLLIGPTGSGKTYGIITPAMESLTRNHFRVIANDVKGDMIQLFKEYKKEKGIQTQIRFNSWNPFDRSPQLDRGSIRWNPLDEINNLTYDTSILESIVQAIVGTDDSEGPQHRYFILQDKAILRGMIKLVKQTNHHACLYDIYELLCNQNKLLQLLQRCSISELSNLTYLLPHEFAQKVTGLTNKLAIFNRPEVRRATSSSSHTLSQLINYDGLLIVHTPLQEGDEAFKLSSLFFSLLRFKIYEQGNNRSIPQYWMIDEASRIAPRLGLENDLAVLRSYKVGIFLAIQSVTQLGKDFHIYSSNCQTKLILPGVDDKSAEFFSKHLGVRQAPNISRTNNGTHYSFQNSSLSKPVLEPSDIMYFPNDFGRYSALFFNPNLITSPILLDFSRN